MLLTIIRATFVLVVAGLAVHLARVTGESFQFHWSISFGATLLLAVAVVVFDILTPRKRIQTITAVYIGLIVGLILSNLVQSAIEPSLALFLRRKKRTGPSRRS